jgi:molybdate transport system substrate-binding protein
MKDLNVSRRAFLTGGAATLATAMTVGPGLAAPEAGARNLQVWSCGGLAEAFIPANALFESRAGARIAYTGAFAAALGKSLLGNAQTEVFAPRVLDLAKKLKEQGKMLEYHPLCFTRYVLVTPKGNPAGITSLADLKRPDVHAVLSPDSSAPGGQAVTGLLKKAGVAQEATANAAFLGSCIQHDVAEVAEGRAHASVVEMRVTRLPRYKDKLEVIDIPEEFFPAPPITFTIGVMKWAKDQELARDFVEFIRSEPGQACFEAAGFIPAMSEEGQRLTAKYGVLNG